MKVLIPIILGISASVLITIAACIPGWMVKEYKTSGYHVYIGLFYGLTCADSCKVNQFSEIYHYEKGINLFWMLEFHVEVILSIIISVVSVIVLILDERHNWPRKRLVTSIIMFVIAGVLVLIGCGRILYATISTNYHMKTIEQKSEFSFSFSFSLVPAILGGILIMMAAFTVCIIRKNNNNEDDPGKFVLNDIWETKVDYVPRKSQGSLSYDTKSRHAV
ncbi:unnamed protein product [Mytilus coruscus]|uniref:Uncharacterized protein n=1 Tax=Mytilus coruscus TaxID=42192 RepID=A0A6J8DTD5_MYTCO|nr:unnamed protein product [Mytilus coruscus]